MKAHLVLLSKTADSISDGDLVDRQIRSRQNWSLLPTQVMGPPGEIMTLDDRNSLWMYFFFSTLR